MLGAAPILYEDGGAIRDYVNIDDVVDANALVLDNERAVGRVFNVGGSQAFTTREFADIVRRYYGSRQPGVVTGEYRLGDVRHIVASPEGATRDLGFRARTRFATGIAVFARAPLREPALAKV